jgi:aspartate/glutamate racemase
MFDVVKGECMKKIAAVYTGAALLAPLSGLLKEMIDGYEIINLLDDALIGEVIAAGTVTVSVRRRLLGYYQILAENGAELILNTCSSVGEVVYEAQPFVRIPILRIDDAMSKEAVTRYKRIGVIATLSTTLDPTLKLVRRWAEKLGKEVSLVNGLADGAFAALSTGDSAKHDQLIMETGKQIAGSCDVILLAQASMMRMEESLQGNLGIPVISSPRRAIEQARNILSGSAE